jgi:hypothetical protein
MPRWLRRLVQLGLRRHPQPVGPVRRQGRRLRQLPVHRRPVSRPGLPGGLHLPAPARVVQPVSPSRQQLRRVRAGPAVGVVRRPVLPRRCQRHRRLGVLPGRHNLQLLQRLVSSPWPPGRCPCCFSSGSSHSCLPLLACAQVLAVRAPRLHRAPWRQLQHPHGHRHPDAAGHLPRQRQHGQAVVRDGGAFGCRLPVG